MRSVAWAFVLVVGGPRGKERRHRALKTAGCVMAGQHGIVVIRIWRIRVLQHDDVG